MDILDILLDILLKPPQPFIGLFLVYTRKTANKLVAEKATLDPYCSVMTKTVMGLLQKTKFKIT